MITYIETNYIEDFDDLKDFCWSGALETLKIVEENNLEDEFFEYVNETLDTENNEYTATDINDFIWYDCDDWLEENIEGE